MTNRMIKDTMLVLKEHLGNYHLLEDEEISRESIVDLIFILEKNIKDVRVAGRCTFRLADVVVIIFLAVLSGCSNCSEFAWFTKIRYPLLEKLGLVSGEVIPSHDTFRRILLLIDPVELEKSIYEELDHFFQQVEKQFNVEGSISTWRLTEKSCAVQGAPSRLRHRSATCRHSMSITAVAVFACTRPQFQRRPMRSPSPNNCCHTVS